MYIYPLYMSVHWIDFLCKKKVGWLNVRFYEYFTSSKIDHINGFWVEWNYLNFKLQPQYFKKYLFQYYYMNY